VGAAVRRSSGPSWPIHPQRSTQAALQLVYLAALVQFAAGVTVLSRTGQLHAAIAEHDPGYTAAQWRYELTGVVHPLVVECGIGFVALVSAWGQGRRRRSARLTSCGGVVVPLLISTDSVLTGLEHN
jgi:hypothetical protein